MRSSRGRGVGGVDRRVEGAGRRQQGQWVRWALCVALCAWGVSAWGCDDDGQAQQAPDTGAATGDSQTNTSADTDAPQDTQGATEDGQEPDTGDATAPQPVVTLTAGAFRWELDPDARALTLRGEGQGAPLLVFDADALQIGEVAAVEDRVNYDPYPFKASGLRKPPLKAWRPVQGMRVEGGSVTQGAATLALDFGEGLGATLRLEVKGDGRIQADWSVAQPERVGYLRIRPQVDDQEGFYGLGEVFDSVNHRGRVRAMQLEIDGDLESGYNEAHVPIPFVIGTRGWGLLIESFYPTVFDVAAEASDRVDALVGVGTGAQGGLRFHVFAAAHPLDVTKGYYDVTGAPKLPARWAFGPWIWRDENRDQAQVEQDLATIRDLDLPASGYWIDRPYATAVNTFDFSAAMFTDPKAMIDGAHSLGFRMALWHTPYLDDSEAAVSALRAEADAQGYYPPQVGVLLNGWGEPIDLTNPAAYAWWQGLIHRYTDMGIEGFKLDYAEDVVPGLLGARNVWAFADGSSERTMHALYQRFYHQVYAETMPADGGFLLCRGGTIGSQTLGVIIWPGDLDANMAKHREVATNREGQTYTAVGGLPAALVAALSLGPSGLAFYGSDTGGYRHSPPDKETFTRWFQQTALSTVMQIGTSTNDVAWEPTPENGFDAELLSSYRQYTRLHLRLFPYVWSYAERLAEDGRPIMRPLGLAYPGLGAHPDDIYMLGDALLVAPVVTYGARERDVSFPGGAWYDWWTGQQVASGQPQTRSVAAPLDTLPLFIASGGIVPMLRPTIDTLAPTTQPDLVDSYATSAGVLYAVLAVPEGEQPQTFEVFDGATLGHARSAEAYSLTAESGAAFTLGLRAEIIGLDASPTSAILAGAPFPMSASLSDLDSAPGWFWDGVRLHLRLEAGAHTVAWSL
jgi:alpha-D-xyloside xylohydrolase